jgi:hypothetical protein
MLRVSLIVWQIRSGNQVDTIPILQSALTRADLSGARVSGPEIRAFEVGISAYQSIR